MVKLFVRRLTKKERDFIYKLIDDKQIGYGALIIALSYDGYSVSEIARRINLHPVNVRKWIRKFNQQGINSLLIKPKKGRPARIDETGKKLYLA